MEELPDHIYRYKYLPFSTGSLKTISEGTIKFSHPLNFNDPFDCMPYYDYGTSFREYKSHNPHIYSRVVSELKLSPSQQIQQKNKLFFNLKRAIESGDWAKTILHKVGVLSLSRTPLSILMWSHYADFHRGFLLELKIPFNAVAPSGHSLIDLLVPNPVDYVSERPCIRIAENNRSNIVTNLLYTKSSEWQYEEEERVVDSKRGDGIHPYSRNIILSAVICGMKMPQENKNTIAAEVQKIQTQCHNQVEVFEAVQSIRNYSIKIPGHYSSEKLQKWMD